MKLKLAILPGDGIGPEVMEAALSVLHAIGNKFNHTLDLRQALVGATAIHKTGTPYPEDSHKICMDADAVLFGAIGSPEFDNDPTAKIRPEHGLLAMRKQLGLFANIRPVTAYHGLLHKSPLKNEVADGADFICIRELTGGLYFGKPQGRSENGQTAYDTCTYSRFEIERIVRMAYQYATKRKNKVTVVDKANILATSRLWREVAKEIASEFPHISTEFLYVDNAAMKIIQNPRDFDIIVTENTFGDILTDEASVIAGSLGLLPSASIGTHTSVFEPIHGSFPQAAGKNIANPLAMILSSAMMLNYTFGLNSEALLIQEAANASIEAGIVTADLSAKNSKAYKTDEVTSWLVKYIKQH